MAVEVGEIESGARSPRIKGEGDGSAGDVPGGELRVILWNGWPNCVNRVLEFLPGLSVLYFLRSSTEEVAACGMGFMFQNVTGMALIVGSGAGAVPLISQAFGASNFPRCGDLLQRQLLIHIPLLIVIAGVWLNTEQILLLMKQPAGVARLTGQYMFWRVWALPALGLKEDVTNFLVAQRVMVTPMVISCAANIANIVLVPFVIKPFGFIGAPLAMTLANNMQALLLMLCARRSMPHAETWPHWKFLVAMQGWRELLAMALPSAVLMLSEWLGWETNLFFAGLLCTSDNCVELDVFPIVANTHVVVFMVHVGFCVAANTVVGNELGAGHPERARRTSNVTQLLVAFIALVLTSFMVFARSWWGTLFATDPNVVRMTGQVLPVCAAFMFLVAQGSGVLSNVLRGMGMVQFPALASCVSFYVIGIPCGLMLTFGLGSNGWGIVGLWTGLVIGVACMVLSEFLFLHCYADWHAASELAQARACGDDGAASPATASKELMKLPDDAEGTASGPPTPTQHVKVSKVPPHHKFGKSSYKPVAADDAKAAGSKLPRVVAEGPGELATGA